MRVRVLVVAGLLIAASGCGLDGRSEEVRAGQEDGTLQEPGAPFSLTEHVALGDSTDSVLAFAGTYPGSGFEDAGRTAVLDKRSGEWRERAEAPFGLPLLDPLVAWIGSGFMVVGVPCEGATDEDGALPVCRPGGAVAALYLPSEDQWKELPAPPVEPGSTVPPGLSATTSSSTYVAFGSDVVAFDHDRQSWMPLPEPPFVPSALCAVDDVLLAAQFVTTPGDPRPPISGKDARPGPEIAAESLDGAPVLFGAIYEAADPGWSQAVAAEVGYAPAQTFGFACSANSVVAVPATDASGASSATATPVPLEFGPSLSWVLLPELPSDVGAVLASAHTESSVFIVGSDASVLFMVDTGRWRTRAGIPTAVEAAALTGSQALVLRDVNGDGGGAEVVDFED